MIIITGSLALDYIMDFPGVFSDHIMADKLHNLNVSFLVDTLKKQSGGTAGNIAYNMGLLGTMSSVFGTVGEDYSTPLKVLEKSGVDISLIKIIKGESTASAFIMTDTNDNQITGFYPGAMSRSSELSLKELNKKPDYMVISPNDPQAMLKLSRECVELKIPYLLDPGMQLPRLEAENLQEMVKGAEILIGNDYEMELIRQKLKLSEEELKKQVEVLITTLGKEGSKIDTASEVINIPPAKADKVVDPTGAGDAYRGGFLSGYLKQLDLKTCGQMGSISSCYTIESYGTTTHSFSLEEFKERYKKNYGEDLRY